MFKEIFEKKRQEAELYPESTIRYRDTTTDEVFEVPWTSANLDKILNNKNNQLVFK